MSESSATLPDSSRKLWRQLLVAQFAAFGIVCLYGVWTQRYLYGDGSNFLLMLLQRGAVSDYFPGRHFAHIVTQTPMIVVIRDLGCRSVPIIASVYGATLYFAPLACLPLTMWAAWRAPGQVLAYPIIAFAILFLDCYGFIISEINIAAAIFWPILYLLLFSTRLTAIRSTVLILLAIVATRCYEIYLFLAWPLTLAAVYRLCLAIRTRSYVDLAVSLVSLGLFVAGFCISAGSIFDPDIPASVDGFLEHAILHLTYPPVWFTLALLAGATWIAILPRFRRGRWIVHGFVIGFGLFATLIMCFGFVGPWFQYSSRVQALYVPLLLGALVTLKTIVPRLRSKPTAEVQIELWRLTAGACCMATVFQLGSTVVWDQYRTVMLTVLAKDQGVVEFEAATGTDWEEEMSTRNFPGLLNRKVGQFYWNWTMPSLSVALSALNFGAISTIISAPEMTEWQPFDPHNRTAIPNLGYYGIRNKLPRADRKR